jgi:anaerobic magnesium-protoporphyrin IX monomethyl ester cyclase
MRELPEISYGIVGEAEESLPALLSSIDNPSSLKGLCRRNGEEIVIARASQEFDMARYISPVRNLLDPRRYLSVNSYVPAIGIESKRGCPFTCSYCVYPALQGKKLRCRIPSSVAEEIEILHKDYGIENFHFTDPVLNIPDGHLEAICDEIIRRKLHIRWDGFMREDRLNEQNVSLFEKAGCECFSFSPDGLHQNALDVLGKNLSVADILKAAELVSKTDAVSVYHFMVNVPGETERSCIEGLRLVESLYELHSDPRNLGTIVLNNIRILPGTRIEAQAKAEGAIRPDADLLYPAYYNPAPFDTLRYKMEDMHFCRNIFMWHNIK